jgi:type I restriction enzyme S subunit
MNWPTESLGSLCDVMSGGTPKRTVDEYWNGEISWVKISDMLQGEIKHTDESITDKGLRESPARLLEPGTLLLSIFATVGRTAVLAIPAATNQAIVGLRIKAENLDQRYLRHYLDSQAETLKSKSRGVAQDNINTSILKNLRIPLPPLEEQRRIAAILDKAENINSLLKARQAAAELLIQSAFIDLFGNPKEEPSNSLFSISTLGERCTLFSGGTLPDGEENTGQEGGFLLLKVSDMNLPGNEERIRTSKLWTSSPGAKSATCPAGSVVIPKRGGAIGTNKKRVVDRDAVLDPNLMAIAPSDNTITTEFLRGWFSFLDLSSITSGSSVPQLNKQDLSPLRLVAPPVQIQEKYNKLSNSVSLMSEELRRQGGRFQSLLAVLRCNYFGGPSH